MSTAHLTRASPKVLKKSYISLDRFFSSEYSLYLTIRAQIIFIIDEPNGTNSQTALITSSNITFFIFGISLIKSFFFFS